MEELNEYLQPLNSPATNNQFVIGFDFESKYEVQSRKIKVSTVQIKNFVGLSYGDAGPVTIGNGVTAYLTSVIDPQPPNQNVRVFGHPYVSVYEGTTSIGSMFIWPDKGNGVTDTDYKVEAGFVNDISRGFNGTNEAFICRVTNNSGGSKTIYFEILWRYANIGLSVSQ